MDAIKPGLVLCFSPAMHSWRMNVRVGMSLPFDMWRTQQDAWGFTLMLCCFCCRINRRKSCNSFLSETRSWDGE